VMNSSSAACPASMAFARRTRRDIARGSTRSLQRAHRARDRHVTPMSASGTSCDTTSAGSGSPCWSY
jgi:hypothetical protein